MKGGGKLRVRVGLGESYAEPLGVGPSPRHSTITPARPALSAVAVTIASVASHVLVAAWPSGEWMMHPSSCSTVVPADCCCASRRSAPRQRLVARMQRLHLRGELLEPTDELLVLTCER